MDPANLRTCDALAQIPTTSPVVHKQILESQGPSAKPDKIGGPPRKRANTNHKLGIIEWGPIKKLADEYRHARKSRLGPATTKLRATPRNFSGQKIPNPAWCLASNHGTRGSHSTHQRQEANQVICESNVTPDWLPFDVGSKTEKLQPSNYKLSANAGGGMRLLTLEWNPPSRPAYLARCLLIMVKAKGPKSRPFGYGRQFAEPKNTIVAAADEDERDESSAIGAVTVGRGSDGHKDLPLSTKETDPHLRTT
ncbi:hypothetical protein EDB87DRAFT_1575562 [Lactarius vividus]|nr:hypothetical protein EDB87DRAFT_1575562 [Lactarius vividus]